MFKKTTYRFFDVKCPFCQKDSRILLEDGKKKIPFCSDCRMPLGIKRKGYDIKRFVPFWSDTLQKPIKNRQDLNELREYAKAQGLTNVGHQKMKPDRKAIKANLETMLQRYEGK